MRGGSSWSCLVIAGFSVVALLSACGGDDSGNEARETSGRAGASGGTAGGAGTTSTGGSGARSAGSEGDAFLSQYAESVCAMYEPCCDAEGLGFDAGGCSEWFSRVTAAYFMGEFRPERGAECLAALAEVSAADPDRCFNVGLFDDATLRDRCRTAFGTPAQSGSPLGGECLLAADCASSDEEGTVICYGGNCLLQRPGAEGDGPCDLLGADELPKEQVVCNPKEGLYCDQVDNVCAPHVEDGEYCSSQNACKPTSFCRGGTCLRGDSGLDVGVACGDPAQCASEVCTDGVCAASDFPANLNCTG